MLLKSGAKVPTSLVVVGVGARPNVELLDGQVEMEPKPVGGIKVWGGQGGGPSQGLGKGEEGVDEKGLGWGGTVELGLHE